MTDKIEIKSKNGFRMIGHGEPCFIVAEISGNHNQSFERAVAMIDVAADAGVDAVKFQTYTADTITINCDNDYFHINDNGLWKGFTLYELYEKASTPWEWLSKLKDYVESKGLIFFSSPFDITAVDFLENMDVEIYKLASLEVVDTPLLERVGRTGKPVIVSSGTASIEDLELCMKTLKVSGCSQVAILHCVSAYPAKPEDMNLLTMSDIVKRFNVVSGISDHSLGTEVSIASVALGASIVEKHITLSRNEEDIDGAFSLEPLELKHLVESIRIVEKSLGKPTFEDNEAEQKTLQFRKSLFVVVDIKKGEKLVFGDNFRSIRPGQGLEPKYYSEVDGKIVNKDVKKGTPLSWDIINS